MVRRAFIIRAMHGIKVRTPVIGVTANVASESPEEAAKVGMNGFLRKPFLHTELREVLHKPVRPYR